MENTFPPGTIELEIAAEVITRLGNTLDILNKLNDLDITLTLTNFGTDSCSLSTLQQYPFKIIKVNTALIRQSSNDTSDLPLLTAICRLAKTLNIEVVAENVQHEEQHSAYRQSGINRVQGISVSKPLTAANFEEQWLKNESI